MAVVDVVPTVAHTITGLRPRATSRSSRAARAAGRIARSPSTSTIRTASLPRPAIRTAFSIDECVSAET
jgi:hypothetical protein